MVFVYVPVAHITVPENERPALHPNTSARRRRRNTGSAKFVMLGTKQRRALEESSREIQVHEARLGSVANWMLHKNAVLVRRVFRRRHRMTRVEVAASSSGRSQDKDGTTRRYFDGRFSNE